MNEITEELLDSLLKRETIQYSTYPSSSDPNKKCYEWDITDHFVIKSHPDNGYTWRIKYFDGYEFITEEIREIKDKNDLLKIIEIIN